MDFGIDYTLLPGHMQESTRLYLERGVMGGDFLQAVFENNLVKAYGNADETNTWAMSNWARFLYNDAPVESWGSKEKVNAWIEQGGLYGTTGHAGHSGEG